MFEQLSAISPKGVESIIVDFKEVTAESLKDASPVRYSMEIIENTSIEQLKAQNELIRLTEADKITASEIEEGDKSEENKGLSEEDKLQIKNEVGWSDEIIDAIGSMKEYRIYRDLKLEEVDINGRKCLVRDDIDWDQKDSVGRTNKERAQEGLSPINKQGDTIELHHIGQKSDGPLAELTSDEHRGKNYVVLHNTQKESEIDRNSFNTDRINHWKERASEGVRNA